MRLHSVAARYLRRSRSRLGAAVLLLAGLLPTLVYASANPAAFARPLASAEAAAAVSEAFAAVLCRTPQPDEVQLWGKLAAEPEQLRATLSSSIEGNRVLEVRKAYVAELGRDPLGSDCGGLRFWAEAEASPHDIRAQLQGSSEGARVTEVRAAFREALGRDPLGPDNASLRRWMSSAWTVPELVTVLREKRPLVGAYYFPWYRPTKGFWGNGNTTVAQDAPRPLLGWYQSSDVAVIRRHLDAIEAAGFDFIIIDMPIGQPVLLDTIQTLYGELAGRKLQAAVMLDDLYKAPPDIKRAWVGLVLNVFGAHPNYFRWQGQPLAPLFAAPIDFDVPGAMLFNVYWTTDYSQGHNNFNHHGFLRAEDWPFWSDAPQPLINGVVPVVPGYGDGYLLRDRAMEHQREDGVYYRRQWANALDQRPEIIMVYSWNEHFEATAIEPTEAWGDSYLRMTACFIQHAHQGTRGECR